MRQMWKDSRRWATKTEQAQTEIPLLLISFYTGTSPPEYRLILMRS
jgi:hypothetical protein